MKRNSLLRRGAALCMALAMLVLPVFAAAPDSLEIVYLDGTEPVSGAQFDIYRVSDLYGDPEETFAESGVQLRPDMTNSGWVQAAQALHDWVNRQGLQPDASGRTGADGRLVFSPLTKGLYLVAGHRAGTGGMMYTAQTFIARVEGASRAEPKFTAGDIPTLDSFAYAGDVNPEMGSRTKWVLEDPDATVTDEVYLGGLVPGEQYELRSVILNDTYDFGFPVPALFNGKSMRDNYGTELGTVAERLVMDVFDAWGIPYPETQGVMTAAYEDDEVPKWHPSGMWFDLPAAVDDEKLAAVLANPDYQELLGLIAFLKMPFTAEAETETVSTVFEHLNTVNKSGQDLRVFQILSKDGYIVATEVVEQYERQTVHVAPPEIDTVALIDGGHVASASGTVTLTDTVTWSGLTPGKEYRLEGRLMDAGTGEPCGITAQSVFVPETESGSTEQTFTFDASGFGGKSLVVYEVLYREDWEMASHCDLADADQTVEFTQPQHSGGPSGGGFSVEKTVSGGGDREREWHFRVTLDPKLNGTYGGVRFRSGEGDFTLKHGETKRFSGLPAGTKYTVTEEEAGEGCVTSSENASGKVQTGGMGHVTFINDFTDDPPGDDPPEEDEDTGKLSVTKHVAGIGDRSRSWHFRMTLDPALSGTYGDLTFENGAAEFTLRDGETLDVSGLPEGTRYEITETEAGADGYVSSSENASGRIEGSLSAVFVNDLEPPPERGPDDPPTGGFDVKKTVTGNGDVSREWHFTVTLDPKLSGTYGGLEFVDGAAEFALKHGQSVSVTGLPEGTQYVIEETDANRYGCETHSSGERGAVAGNTVQHAEFVNFRRTAVPPPNEGPTVPQTGDTSRPGMWTALMVLSLAGIVLLTRKKKW